MPQLTELRAETGVRNAGAGATPPTRAGRPPTRPRRRRAGGLLLPPWTRAPWLGLREPAVLLAVVAATAILACASSSAALFLSSAATETLHRTLAADCPNAGYPGLQVGPVTAAPAGQVVPPPVGVPEPARNIADLAGFDRRARAALTGVGFSSPYHVALSDEVLGASAGTAQPHRANLIFRDGVTSQITPISRGAARGIWVPAALATQLDLVVGMPLRMSGSSSASLPVAGIYRDLWQAPTTPYWCSYGTLFQNLASVDPPPPALLVASDAAVFAQVQRGTGLAATHFWAAPIQTGHLTLSGARGLVARQSAAYRRLGEPPPQDLGAQNTGAGQLPVFAQRTALVRNGLRGPVVPIALGGTILALLLVGAAGSYWADRRYREVRLLSSRGVSPAALAGKAVLELALPAVAGTVLGWLLARWLVRSLGPNPDLDRAAPGQALATAGVALAAGLALLALVAGLRSRAATERPVGAGRSWPALVPWELLLLAAAGGCYLRLRAGSAVVVVQNVAQVNLLVVAFPLLFLLGSAVLVVRLLALLLPAAARLTGRRSAAWYLAGRRIVASRTVSVTLLAAASMPIAMSVYAAGLTQTSRYTLDAKANLLVGSAISVTTTDPLHRTPDTDRIGTVVTRYLYGQVAGQDVAILAIDPDTFARTAFWDRRLADLPLATLLDRLRQPTAGGRVPALVAEGQLPPRFDVPLGRTTARLDVVATARLFPGRRLPRPMVIVSAARLGPVDPHAGTENELWTTGSLTAAEDAITRQHATVFDYRQRDTVFAAADYLGISWTFGYLAALAALVGLVAAGGLLLYLETRQRSRIASYALGRRMGLTRATHLRSLLAELGVLLTAAYLIGTALAGAAVLLVYHRLDVDLIRPPAPLLTIPTAAIAGAAGTVAVITVLASFYAQRAADRTDVATVLRLGG